MAKIQSRNKDEISPVAQTNRSKVLNQSSEGDKDIQPLLTFISMIKSELKPLCDTCDQLKPYEMRMRYAQCYKKLETQEERSNWFSVRNGNFDVSL